MSILETLTRLTGGYYNSNAFDEDDNPGGFAVDGHQENFPAALGDVGDAAVYAGEQADASATAKTASEEARDLAQKWASEEEDVPVAGGEFSAAHYRAKTAALKGDVQGLKDDVTGLRDETQGLTNEAEGYRDQASASAAAAQATLDAAAWNDVVFITNAGSPFAVTDAMRGKMISVDATGGNVVVNLPAIAGLTLDDPWSLAIKKSDASANTVTINRNGTDTIDGATSVTLDVRNQGVTLIPDTDPAPDRWTAMSFGYDKQVAAFVGLASAADRLPYFTGAFSMALATFTGFGRSLLAAANAAAARTALGLDALLAAKADVFSSFMGWSATEMPPAGADCNALNGSGLWYMPFSAANRPGGTLRGTLFQAVHDRGGTDDIEKAQTFFSTDAGSPLKVFYRQLDTDGVWSGWARVLTDALAVTVAQGGTGATDAATARTNLGLGTSDDVQFDTIKFTHASGSLQPDTSSLPTNAGVAKFRSDSSLPSIASRASSDASLRVHLLVESAAGDVAGSVSSNGGATNFATTSDPRRKKMIEALDEAASLDRVMAVEPKVYSWRETPDDEAHDEAAPRLRGFLTTDVQPHVPTAVTGEPDEMTDVIRVTIRLSETPNVEHPGDLGPLDSWEETSAAVPEECDEDGAVIVPAVAAKGTLIRRRTVETTPPDFDELETLGEIESWEKIGERPVYQGLDMSKMVPDLWAATRALKRIVDAQAETIASLEARIEALEATS